MKSSPLFDRVADINFEIGLDLFYGRAGGQSGRRPGNIRAMSEGRKGVREPGRQPARGCVCTNQRGQRDVNRSTLETENKIMAARSNSSTGASLSADREEVFLFVS